MRSDLVGTGVVRICRCHPRRGQGSRPPGGCGAAACPCPTAAMAPRPLPPLAAVGIRQWPNNYLAWQSFKKTWTRNKHIFKNVIASREVTNLRNYMATEGHFLTCLTVWPAVSLHVSGNQKKISRVTSVAWAEMLFGRELQAKKLLLLAV